MAIAGVLLQLVDGIYKPVAFASRKLSPTEQRYSATERELLAIVYCYMQFYSHVYGRKIKIYTDHQPLVTYKVWSMSLFIYLPGDQNFLPNFLSRAVEPESDEAKANMIELRSSIDWKVELAKDAEVAQVVRLVSENAPEVSWAVNQFCY